MIEKKTLELTNDSILINFSGTFWNTRPWKIYKPPDEILGKNSLVPGRLTFLSLQKMKPTNNPGGSPTPPPPNYPPLAMRNDPWIIIIEGMAQGDVMLCFYYFINSFFVTVALLSQSRFVFFAIFLFFLALFCYNCGKEKTKNLTKWPNLVITCNNWILEMKDIT